MKILISSLWILFTLPHHIQGDIKPLVRPHAVPSGLPLDLSSVTSNAHLSKLFCTQCNGLGQTDKTICLQTYCSADKTPGTGPRLPPTVQRVGDGFCAACKKFIDKPHLYTYCRQKFCLHKQQAGSGTSLKILPTTNLKTE